MKDEALKRAATQGLEVAGKEVFGPLWPVAKAAIEPIWASSSHSMMEAAIKAEKQRASKDAFQDEIAAKVSASLANFFESLDEVSWQQLRQRAHQIEIQEVALRQSQVQLQLAYINEMRSWATRATTALQSAVSLCYLSDEESCSLERARVINELSVMIDVGRWFFVNLDGEHYGTHKEGAYRGVRSKVLDPLAYVAKVLMSNPMTLNPKFIVGAKRNFVSYIQEIINPLRLQEYISGVALSDRLVGLSVGEVNRSLAGKEVFPIDDANTGEQPARDFKEVDPET